MKLSLRLAMALAAALTLTAPDARAGFVPVLTSPPAGGTASTFTYSLNFTTNAGTSETLSAGDFITLYDFDAGVTSAGQVTAPAGITTTVQNVGITPPGGLVNPTDNPGIANITFTYTGATLTADTTFTVSIATAGGPYTTRTGQYTSTDTIALPGDNNQIGAVLLPTAVPEPVSLVSAALGLLGLGSAFGYRARRRPA